jgi:intracellular septation protein
MKLLLDFLPLLLFFTAYRVADSQKDWAMQFANQHFGFLVSGGTVQADEAPIMLATLVVIAATLAQVLVLKAMRQKIHAMLWVSLVLVVVFGGLTIWFHNDTFIKWKPSVLYWTMSLVLWLAPLLAGRNLLKVLLAADLELPSHVWQRLNTMWVAFFAAMGLINVWIAFSFSRDTWVTFKSFGATALMVVFVIAQGLYLSRYLEQEPPAEPRR